jgi:His-Xaa-Ser system radical SAM maturase HxsB
MAYCTELYPFRTRLLDASTLVAVSKAGDFTFFTQDEIENLLKSLNTLPHDRLAELKSKFFLGDPQAPGMARLLASRTLTKHETVLSGPSLHILVPTLSCEHSCRYCQVSRSLESVGYSMSTDDLDVTCEAIFQSPSPTLTVEFQGGDPLLRFDLVKRAIERITSLNEQKKRRLRFVVASTLHQLEPEMCAFFKAHEVYFSTSIDGPASLHNRNRPHPTRDAYERTVAGIRMAREFVSAGSVSALMTTTRDSLGCPEDIVDTYVELGFDEIFIRPLNHYGFARRNAQALTYTIEEFNAFYERAFERVLDWNRRGVPIREVTASIAFNKILSPIDAGYVDLQISVGAGLAVLIYNYDGYVYPSDEARMLAETGDTSLRLGRIGESLESLLSSRAQRQLIDSCEHGRRDTCDGCTYGHYCGPDPISAYNQSGSWSAPVQDSNHCQYQIWLFDFLFHRLRWSDTWFEDLACRWSNPNPIDGAELDA